MLRTFSPFNASLFGFFYLSSIRVKCKAIKKTFLNWEKSIQKKLRNKTTIGTRNKAKDGKNRIIFYCECFPFCKSQLFLHGKSVSTEKYTEQSFYTFAESLIASSVFTVGTCNKAKVGQNRIVPYYESFPYCESQQFKQMKIGQHRKVSYCELLYFCKYFVAK